MKGTNISVLILHENIPVMLSKNQIYNFNVFVNHLSSTGWEYGEQTS